ncbi:PilT/PilU family type 4a pilus ATPase [bacterium]|nr:PilT/PilU family type 4a pilus ATPase [bacterium]
MTIEELFKIAVEKGASDIHLVSNMSPALRIRKDIFFIDAPPLKPEEIKELIYSLLREGQEKILEEERQLCFSLLRDDLGHFRIAVYFHRGMVEAAIRVRKLELKSIEALSLPPVLKDLANKPHGLIVISGPTGSGKTTTFYSVLDLINNTRKAKIITVEDPIEYVHTHKKSIFVQQEIYKDATSFNAALHHILRQDPDVIGVGEMRDKETIQAALNAAETGHLVIATLHTSAAAQTIDRILDVFPGERHAQVRTQLSNCLQGTLSQILLPRTDIKGLVPACEVLIATEGVRNIIRDDKLQMLPSTIQAGGEYKMQSLDRDLKRLFREGIITKSVAIENACDPKEFLSL